MSSENIFPRTGQLVRQRSVTALKLASKVSEPSSISFPFPRTGQLARQLSVNDFKLAAEASPPSFTSYHTLGPNRIFNLQVRLS